jgi:hypothetical protein
MNCDMQNDIEAILSPCVSSKSSAKKAKSAKKGPSPKKTPVSNKKGTPKKKHTQSPVSDFGYDDAYSVDDANFTGGKSQMIACLYSLGNFTCNVLFTLSFFSCCSQIKDQK